MSIGFSNAEFFVLHDTTPTTNHINHIPRFDNLPQYPRNVATLNNIKNICSSQVLSINPLYLELISFKRYSPQQLKQCNLIPFRHVSKIPASSPLMLKEGVPTGYEHLLCLFCCNCLITNIYYYFLN